MKEECLAERISITKVKNAAKNDQASNVFLENEFAVSHEINEIR